MEFVAQVMNLLQVYGEKGNLLGSHDFGLNAHFNNLATTIGFPMDQVRYIILLVLMYPLAALQRHIPTAPLKHLTGLVLGLWLCQLCFGNDWIHSFLSSAVTYILLLVSPKSKVHLFVWVWMMGYMSVSHIYRMYTSYLGWELDYTGPQMILTQKLTSLAFAYYDGVANRKATEEQKQRSIKAIPNPLEFFGYVYFHPGFLAGPAFDYTEYVAYLDEKNTHPGRTKAAFGTFAYSLLCFALHVGLGTALPAFKQSSFLSADWESRPLLEKVGVMWIVAFITRMRYYFAWLLAEGACVMAGLGFNGVDKHHRPQWDALRNADPIAFETALNIRECSVCWNKLTSRWLKRTVYERTPKSINTYATYAVSAFWHGFYPGYYMFFLTVAVFNSIPADARKKIRPFFLTADGKHGNALKPLYDGVTWIATTLIINYWVMSFLLLDFWRAFNFWKSVGFYGHLAPIPLGIILFFLRTPRAPHPPGGKPEAKTH